MDKYTPERTWLTPLEAFVAGASTTLRLFTPWPAGATADFYRRLASGPAPLPNRLTVGSYRYVSGMAGESR